MSALVIRNGHLIDPAAGVDAPKDILLKDGKVADIAGPGKLKGVNGAETIDAAGLVVAPGLIDIHVHLRLRRQRAVRRARRLMILPR